MKKLLIPTLLAVLGAAQLIRIERVAAEETGDAAKSQPSESDSHGKKPMTVAEWMAQPRLPSDQKAQRDAYIIEPPDILGIEGVRLIPNQSHLLEPFDVVSVRVEGALPEQPIDDNYSVDADGKINFGLTYGRVRAAGLSIEDCNRAITERLARKIRGDLTTTVTLVSAGAASQVTRQHLVAADGRVNLGVYGHVYVSGMTLEKARTAIERKLALRLEDPEVHVDLVASNSKVYYIIIQGAEGDDVIRQPITGNETVMDALAVLGGPPRAAKTKMWITRPAHNAKAREQVLPIVWGEAAEDASIQTNHTLRPGDRLFIVGPATRPPAPKRTRFSPTQDPDQPRYSSHVRPTSAATPIPPAPQANPPAAPSDNSVAFEIAIIEDSRGSLDEFESLRGGLALDDMGVLADAIRVLEKNELVTCVASPQLITPLGQTGEMNVAQAVPHKDRLFRKALAVSVRAEEAGEKLSIELKIDRNVGKSHFSMDTTIEMKSGQTAVMSGLLSKDKSGKRTATYVVLTPTLIH